MLFQKKNQTSDHGETLWNPAFIAIILLGFFVHLTSQMVTPLLTAYAITKGATLTIAASLSSILSIAALCCRPFSGALCDRANRKTIMIVSVLITSLCVAGYIFANNIAVLFVLRVVHGVSFSFMGVANMAFAASFIPEKRMGEGFGYMTVGNLLASALGPSLGLLVSDQFGYQAAFSIASASSLISVFLILWTPYKHTHKEVKARKRLSLNDFIERKILLYALILGLLNCGAALMSTFMKLIGAERGIANIGLYSAAYSAVVLFARPMTGKLCDRKGLAFVLLPSLVMAAGGMVFVGAANALWMIIIAGMLKAFGQGVASPALQSTCVKQLGRERAGVASSTCYIGQDIGASVAPILGSFVVDQYGYGTLFYGYAGLLVAFGVIMFAVQRLLEKRWIKTNT